MKRQSTRHIMMMEPAEFFANPQTFATNQYQDQNPADIAAINAAAIAEFRAFRDTLVETGVVVTTARGQKGAPDDIFVNNWVSTHDGRRMAIYPMLAQNRRIERRPELLEILQKSYDVAVDFSEYEGKGKFLESTGSLCQDRVNGIVYAALSPRTDPELARIWCEAMGLRLVAFDTRNHAGKPVYHTDVLMWIGTGVAGVCAETIVSADRERVLQSLRTTHEVVELTMDQMRAFAGNALEVRGADDAKFLIMSGSAERALRPDQKEIILRHVDGIVSADIPTIERYGGGSARCMLLELF